jgi:sec-independent protein translocase protein TatA
MGSDLGKSVKGFKDGVKVNEEDAKKTELNDKNETSTVIDSETKDSSKV